MTNLIGQSLGRYHILEQLGEGGMATVYKAFDTRLETDVAVKVIRTERLAPEILERSLKRFEREAKALARLTHPNIVKVTDYGEHEGKPYLVMPFLPGGTLKDHLKRGPLTWQECIRLLLPIAEALDFAHSQNMIHRDVKPSNILLTQRGQPMLTDFGIAKILDLEETADLTGTGMGIGTPEYMAPEQWTGKTSALSDQYSLGVVLYEMLTGRKPYTADTPAAILLKQATEPLPRPSTFSRDLPEKVEKLLIKALAKNPDDRYANMGDFATALEAVLSGTPVPSKPQVARTREKTRDSLATIDQSDSNLTIEQDKDATVNDSPAISIQKPATKTERKLAPSGILRYWPVAVGGILVVCILAIALVIPSMQGSDQIASSTRIPTITNTNSVVFPTIFATNSPSVATKPSAPVSVPTNEVNLELSGEVTFWHAYGTDSAEEIALNKILKQAKTDLPNVSINVLQVPFNDIFNKYRNEVASGGGPNMILVPNDSLGDDARAGLIADITELAKGKLSDYTPLSIDGMSVDGKLYGIPESLKAIVFWYNKDMITIPPATTDELKAMMEGGTEVSISYGCYHHFGFFSAFGGKVFDEKWKVVADQGGVADAMAYLNDLYQISKTNGWPKNDYDGLAPFTEGKAAAITNGNWAMGDYKKALGDKLAVVPLPAGPGGSAAPFLGVDGFYFNPNSANIDIAIGVARYLTGKWAQQIMMDDAGHVPVNTKVTTTDPLMLGLLAAFENGYVRPQVPQLGLYWSNFCGTDDVFERGVPATDWVRDATANANR